VSFRVGSGFDAHRLAPGRRLMLGGVEVPHDRGLLGHSDGDCVAHAVCDALLGAAGAGDMGHHFPSREPRWKDVSGVEFARRSARIVRERGYEIENVDATVIAEAPALKPHLAAMSGALAEALTLEAERVSVKAKSSDGLGALGRGEGIAALAVALLRRSREGT
jgi:2-C-methyl-D-erythritol 2,4-cyclodiphosphate synthase